MKDYAQAITRFKNCIALDLQAQDLATLLAYQGLTEVYVAQKKYDEAISFLKASARLTDQNFEVLRLLATVYEKAGRADDAITTYKSYTAASPQNTGALYLLAVFYEKAAKIQEAMDLYSKIIGAPSPAGVDNIRLLSYVNMSNIYVRQNRQADAIDLMTKAVAMVPERNWKAKLAQDLLLHLVFLYDTAGRGDEAETLLKKMLAADPDNPQANNYLGYFYADRGIHLDRAVELVNRALKVEPNSGAYLDSLAWALFKQAKAGGSPSLQDVLQKLLQAAERNKQEEGAEDPVILDHIAVVYFSLGQWEQAKARWTASLARAQELAKDRPNALPNIDQVRKLLDLVTTCLSEEERSRRLRLPLSQREQRTQR
jgi:tetratricopeptide (TPR) repeat protein